MEQTEKADEHFDDDKAFDDFEAGTTQKKGKLSITGFRLSNWLAWRNMNDGEASHPVGYMTAIPWTTGTPYRGIPWQRRGELIDPDDGMSHALHVACNGMILDRMLEAGKKLVFEKEKA